MAVGAAHESPQPVSRDDPVAGHHWRNRIAAAGTTEGARDGSQAIREFTIREHHTYRYATQRVPDTPTERCAIERDREVEGKMRVLEVSLELAACLDSQRLARRPESTPGREILDARDEVARQAHADATEGRRYAGVARFSVEQGHATAARAHP